MRVWQRVNCGLKVRGLTQALITVSNTISNISPTNPNPNLTNATYPPTHTQPHTCVPQFTHFHTHPQIHMPAFYQMPFAYLSGTRHAMTIFSYSLSGNPNANSNPSTKTKPNPNLKHRYDDKTESGIFYN